MSKKKLDITNLTGYRNKFLVRQCDFWSELGVSQSCGSRFEAGRQELPKPVALLLILRESGKITSKDLADAKKFILKAKVKK